MKVKCVVIILLASFVLTACSPLSQILGTRLPDESELTATAVAIMKTEAYLMSSLEPNETETPQPSPTAENTATETLVPTPTPTAEPTLGVGSTMVNPVDGARLVFVPEGEFTMGSEDEGVNQHEAPEHPVWLDAFWIYQTEVTNAQFTSFIDDSGYQTTAEEVGWSYTWNMNKTKGAYWKSPFGPGSSINGKEDYPVVHVSWYDAEAYCQWAGGRLLTEAEWEKAARGTDGRTYPWGDDAVTGQKANFCDVNCSITGADINQDDGFESIAPVGSYPEGASPYGALDMAGNVWEWVADWYNWRYYSLSPYKNPTGGTDEDSENSRGTRGGSWYNVESYLRVFNRSRLNPDGSGFIHGFRCLRSPEP